MLNQAFLSGNLENLIDLQVSEALNIDGSAFLIGLVVEVRVDLLDLIVLLKLEDLHTYRL